MRLRTFAILAVALLILASGGAVWSQTVQGVITGTVTDPTGAVVPNAAVTITNVGTNISQSTTTGGDGTYRFPLVPPGTYTIEIKAGSFATVKASGIVVEASQTVAFNRQLELAKAEQVIEVTEQVPLVQTATSDLSTQIDRETIQNAPLVDRDVMSTLPFLAPQVMPGLNLMPAAGGARESGTAYLLNGGDDNDNFSEGAINIHPPLESVQDFSILTNQMSAEYGRGIGAVVSVNQVSGTNKFHGALYEFNRNATLNADDYFYHRDFLASQGGPAPLPARPKYIKNQFGGIISGPIRKDKTFFSFAYDRVKLLAGSTAANQFVPTSAGFQALQTNPNLTSSPLAQQILSSTPPVTSNQPCPGQGTWGPYKTANGGPVLQGGNITGAGTNPFTGLPNNVGCLSFFDPQTDTQDAYYGRLDHNFSNSDRISFNANIFRELFADEFGGGGLTTKGPINSSTTNHFHQLALSETHTFSPRLFNEVTVSHNRHFNVGSEGTPGNTMPQIIIDNQIAGCLGYSIGGPFEGGQVVGFVQDRWGLTDNLTYTVGRHSFKFGGGQQYGILYRNWDLGLPGDYEFGELYSVNAPTTTDPTTPNDPTPVIAPCALTASCPSFTPTSDGTAQPGGTIANVSDQTHSNFTKDYPYFQETSIDPRTGAKASAYRHYTYHDYYAFAQDNFKITSRLTLNLGVRWDRYGAPSEDHGILAQFTNLGSCNFLTRACIAAARVNPVSRMWNTQNHDFAPRVGFAWDPTGKGKMAIRGGFGISYDRIFDNIWSNGAWNPPFYALLDFNANAGDAVFYSNPASIGAAYNPNGPNGPIPYPGKRVSVRTMDVNMKDSSGQNYYFGVERQLLGNFLIRADYQGSLGRHLPMLENLNRTDGQAYNLGFSNRRPNPLYTGFNYRSNSVSSNYNALVLEAQKRMGHGLQFQTGYTFSKLLDFNSDLFAGCSTIGNETAPYYYITNTNQRQLYGKAAYDHKSSYKFTVTYEIPFMKTQKGFAGHALGGWTLSSLYQLYSGHPIDVFIGRTRVRARDANTTAACASEGGAIDPNGCLVLDQNGIPFNIGGDYNLDNVLNDHPVYLGSSLGAAYSGASPADGIFTANSRIACGFPGMPANIANNTGGNCPGSATGNSLFGNPAYPGGATPYLRFGSLGRDVFHGPRFQQLDMALSKTFKLTETKNLMFRAAAQNLANHPDFDCVTADLNSSHFGKAQCLAQNISQGLGAPAKRVMTVGLRLAF